MDLLARWLKDELLIDLDASVLELTVNEELTLVDEGVQDWQSYWAVFISLRWLHVV